MEARSAKGTVGTKVRSSTSLGSRFVREVGEVAGFSARAVFELHGVARYAAEILRQCGVLILGTTLIAAFAVMVGGGECGLFSGYAFRTIGAEALTGYGSAICGLRELYPLIFGYIFAAKVGCGLAAEIGSMRISEELDGLQSVGVDPMRYVIGTRLLATVICVPLMYVVATLMGALASYLVIVVQLHNSSQGAWEATYWLIQTPADTLLPMLKAIVIAIAIVLVGMYYGFRASGGPVGVGAATARSMIVNLVLIHALNAIMTALFYAGNPAVPFGG